MLDMDIAPGQPGPMLPLHIARALQVAEETFDGGRDGAEKHHATLALADALTCYVGAVAVAQYSQALLTGQVEADPTLNRSLRSLRRVLPGQWLAWAAKSLEAVSDGPVSGLSEWYLRGDYAEVGAAYEALRRIMVAQLAYDGDYGSRQFVPPRILLEMIDQYRIRRGKMPGRTVDGGRWTVGDELDGQVASALFPGLRALLDAATFLGAYQLYAPEMRQLLMGVKPATPMPPMTVPVDLIGAATLLLYPPGAAPDYTKRPTLGDERLPVFPLDPLLVYIQCGECDRYRVAALNEVVNGTPTYRGLDPHCGHKEVRG
jgi:hypothetical protein